jgi:hypothetical protein
MTAISIALPVIGVLFHICFWSWFIYKVRKNKAKKKIAAAPVEPEMERQALITERNGEDGDAEGAEVDKTASMEWEKENAESILDLDKPFSKKLQEA